MHFEIIAVGLGGFIGAILRFLAYRATKLIYVGSFPVATLLVNGIGCFLLGIITAIIEGHDIFSENVKFFLIAGILGSLTTFSTFGFETYRLIRNHHYSTATFNIILSLVIALVSMAAGRYLGKQFI